MEITCNPNEEQIFTVKSEAVEMSESYSETSSCSTSDDDGVFSVYSVQGEMMGLQPYQFEPVIDNVAESHSDSGDEYSEDEDENRLANSEW